MTADRCGGCIRLGFHTSNFKQEAKKVNWSLWESVPVTIHHVVKSRQELKAGTGGRNRSRGHGERLLIGLFLMAGSACFLIEPRTTSLGMVPPTVGWAPPH